MRDQERRAWKVAGPRGMSPKTCAVADGDEAEKAVMGRAVVC